MGFLLAFKSVPNEIPAPGNVWTPATKGDANGSIVENSNSSLTISATGTNDTGNQDYAYQTVTSGDIQIIAKIPSSWTGHIENFTGFGVGITEGTADGDYFAQTWWPNVGTARGKHGTPTSNASVAGRSDQTLDYWVGLTYDDTAKEIQEWESADNITWYKIGSAVSKTLTYNLLTYVFGTSHNVAATTIATITDIALTSSITLTDAGPPVGRSLAWECAFETGQLQDRSLGGTDGANMKQVVTDGTLNTITGITKADPGIVSYSGTDPTEGQPLLPSSIGGMTELNGRLIRAWNVNTGANTFEIHADNDPPGAKNTSQVVGVYAIDTSGFTTYTSGGTLTKFLDLQTRDGGLAPGSGYPCRVVDTGTIAIGGDSNVASRVGSYFFKGYMDYNYPYDLFTETAKNKPRWEITPPSLTETDWDLEAWFGFSFYIPSDFNVENPSSNNASHNMIATIVGKSASNDHFHLFTNTPSGASVSHWLVDYTTNATNVTTSGGTITRVDLGPMELGAWTDFVVRYRANPFSTSTNASTVHSLGQDRVFAGNTGILQVWMNVAGQTPTLVVDIENAPYGLVPQTNEELRITIRNYRFPWHHTNTNNTGTIEMGVDEIRQGQTILHGTSFSDVHPVQASQP